MGCLEPEDVALLRRLVIIMLNLYLLNHPDHESRREFRSLKDRLRVLNSELKEADKRRKELTQELNNVPSARESKTIEKKVEQNRLALDEMQHERTIRLPGMSVTDKEAQVRQFLDSVVESRDRRQIEADQLINRARIQGFEAALEETQRKLEAISRKKLIHGISRDGSHPNNSTAHIQRRCKLLRDQVERLKLAMNASSNHSATTFDDKDQVARIGLKNTIYQVETKIHLLRSDRPWLARRLARVARMSEQTMGGKSSGVMIRDALGYCIDNFKVIYWKIISTGFHNLDRFMFEDIRLCWYMCSLVLYQQKTHIALSPGYDGWSMASLMYAFERLWSPSSIVKCFPDERHDDMFYLSRFINDFDILMNDGAEGKTTPASDDFRRFFDCIRPQKHQPKTGKNVIQTMLRSTAPDSIAPLAATIQTFFTLGCYTDSLPCMIAQDDLGALLDIYARRYRLKAKDIESLESFYLSGNHYVVGTIASKEYVNYAMRQILPALKTVSPGIEQYRHEIHTVCNRWRSERNTVYISDAVYKSMNKLKSTMADYGAKLRPACGFWSMVEKKNREGKNKPSRVQVDHPHRKTRKSRSLVARYIIARRSSQGLPVGHQLTHASLTEETQAQDKALARLKQAHFLFTTDALINARSEVVTFITHTEITEWEKFVLSALEVLPYQHQDFLTMWRFGVLVGRILGMTAVDEHVMLLLMADFYCKRLGPATIETAIKEACRHSLVIRAVSILWASFVTVCQLPIPLLAAQAQQKALHRRLRAFFKHDWEYPQNMDYLLFCPSCSLVMSNVNRAFEIGKQEPPEILVATNVMGFSQTIIRIRDKIEVKCARTGQLESVKCRESNCKYVPMIHRVTYFEGTAFICCGKCFIGMTISPYYTFYHSTYWALCSHCTLHAKIDNGPDYPFPVSPVYLSSTTRVK